MARTERSGRRGLTLLVTLLLCGGLSALHYRIERGHGHDPVTGAVRDAALVPAQGLTMQIGHWWHEHIASAFNGPSLARQNTALKAQVAVLTLQNQRLTAAQAENVRLRQLLQFQQKSDRAPLAAEVIALKPSALNDTLTVSRGLRDGVRRQTIALGPNGALVGQVIDIDLSHSSSSVLLLTDSGSSVGAQVVHPGKPGAVGICTGNRTNRLVLTDLPRDADVRPGDVVTTSGLGRDGGVYPKGIRIGIVLSVVADQTRSLKTAQVKPAVDFNHLEDVFLLIPPETPAAGPDQMPDAAGLPGASAP